MARRSKKRVPRGRFLLRWLGVGTLAFIAFLYWQPLRSYLGTRDAVKQQSAEVRALREQKLRLERRLAESDTPQAVTREARRLGYVVARRAPVHRQGHPRLASPARAERPLASRHGADRAARRKAARPAAARFRPRRRPLSVRRPAVTEQSPYDDSGEPFPTTYYVTCRHLVAAISQARGGRRRGALVRARRSRSPTSPRASSAPPRSSDASAPSSPRVGPAATRETRSSSGSAAPAIPSSSSACTRTSPSRWRGPATSSASGSRTRSSRCGRRDVAWTSAQTVP